jgi:hypothetical protein
MTDNSAKSFTSVPLGLFLLIFLWAFPVAVCAMQTKYVAVFETTADADSVMTEAELRYLTNDLRKLALQVLPPGSGYTVMTRENIYSLLPPDRDRAECFEGKCLVEVGRNIGADYAAKGTVSRFGQMLTLTVECYETMGGGLIATFTAESFNVNGLLLAMRKNAPTMFSAISGKTTETVVAEPVGPPPPAPAPVPPEVAPIQPEPITVAEPVPEVVPQEISLDQAPLPEVPQDIDALVSANKFESKTSWTAKTWVALGVAALAVGAGVAGVVQHMEYSDANTLYKAVDAKIVNAKDKILEACGYDAGSSCYREGLAAATQPGQPIGKLNAANSVNKKAMDSYNTDRLIWWSVAALSAAVSITLFAW